jgi:hypothetical protein
MALTDISGIGAKTAEKLEQEGITTERELAEARRRGDPSLEKFGKRVNDAAKNAAIEEYGGFQAPGLGVEVTEENKSVIETFTSRTTSDLNESGRVNRNRNLTGEPLLELGRQAVSGGELLSNLGNPPSQQDAQDTIVTFNPDGPNEVEDREQKERMKAERNFAEMGFDVAANLANVDRETIKEANQIRSRAESPGRTGEDTAFTYTDTYTIGDEEKETEKDVEVEPREYAAAKRIHNARPPMAKRVDSNRQAETVTGDLSKWKQDMDHLDYAGVDTKKKGAEAGRTFDDTERDQEIEATFTPTGDGFRVTEFSEDDDPREGRTERLAGEILSAPQEQQRLVLNDLLPGEDEVDELGLEIRGPDRELFFGDAEGDFL